MVYTKLLSQTNVSRNKIKLNENKRAEAKHTEHGNTPITKLVRVLKRHVQFSRLIQTSVCSTSCKLPG